MLLNTLSIGQHSFTRLKRTVINMQQINDALGLGLVSFLVLSSTAVYYSLRFQYHSSFFHPLQFTMSLRLAQKALWLAYSVIISSYEIIGVTLYSFTIFGFQQPARWQCSGYHACQWSQWTGFYSRILHFNNSFFRL